MKMVRHYCCALAAPFILWWERDAKRPRATNAVLPEHLHHPSAELALRLLCAALHEQHHRRCADKKQQ